jgi:hypothetical protein
MKAFEFDHNLIDSYARFSRSFSTIRARTSPPKSRANMTTAASGPTPFFR